jgi:hypothetical protein
VARFTFVRDVSSDKTTHTLGVRAIFPEISECSGTKAVARIATTKIARCDHRMLIALANASLIKPAAPVRGRALMSIA